MSLTSALSSASDALDFRLADIAVERRRKLDDPGSDFELESSQVM